MEYSAHVARRAFRTAPAVGLANVGGWLFPLLLVVYLGLKGGGYDVIIQGELGLAAWWIVFVGSVLGVLPLSRVSARGWVAVALLAGFVLWTFISIGWSESQEQGWVQLAHVATLVSLFVLALVAQRNRAASRRFVGGIAAGVALIAWLALMSRLEPTLFSPNQVAEFLPESRPRLHYPLNYWNALAAFVAIGLPLVCSIAMSARRLVLQALAAGSIPAMVLTLYFTLSRGGALAAAIGLIVFVALTPRRPRALATLAIAAPGSAILIAAAAQRPALEHGLTSQSAQQQGDAMLAMVLVVCVGVALLHTAGALARHYHVGPRFRVPVRVQRGAAAVIALLAIAVAVTSGAPAALSERWQEFKKPEVQVGRGQSQTAARFQSSSGHGRYQIWQGAIRAGKTNPIRGIGAGSFQLWWKQHGKRAGSIRRAHSQAFQTFAELGIVGSVLVGGFFLLVLGSGVLRTRRGPGRTLAAAATGGAATFAVATSVDWVWEVTVVPAVFLGLAAVVLAPRGDRQERQPGSRVRLLRRVLVAAASLAAVVGIAIPLASTSFVRDSQAHFNSGLLGRALEDARRAQQIQPYAATPRLQRALILERAGRLQGAAQAAGAATSKEPTNWTAWVVLSRLEAKQGRPQASVRAYRKARSLNPRSPLFLRSSTKGS